MSFFLVVFELKILENNLVKCSHLSSLKSFLKFFHRYFCLWKLIYISFFENAKRCYNAFVWEGGSRDIMLKVEKSIIDFRSMNVEGTFPLALWRPLISVFYF